MTDNFKRPDQGQLDLQILQSLPNSREAMMLIGAIAGGMLFILLGASGVLDGFILWGYYSALSDHAPLRVLMVGCAGLIGFVIGWFMTPDAGPARAFVVGFLGSVLGYFMFVDHGYLGWGSAWLFAWFAFFGGLGYWARRFVQKLAERPTTLGSAEWADLTHLVQNNIVGDEGIQLGAFETDDGLIADLCYNGDRHILTVGPTRKWKGTSAIIPNLLTYEGSVMVIDPKGENAMITADHREKLMGQAVYIIDAWGITGQKTARINPMDWLVKGDVDIAENALLLADAIIVTMGENEQFWTEEAKALLLGVILLVAFDDQYAGHRNLGTVRDLLCQDGKDLQDLFKQMLNCEHPVVRSTGARNIQKEEKLLSNVLASVQAQTHFLESRRVREALSVSDFSFEDLKANPTSIYLVVPSDRLNAYGRFLRLLIQQALTVNARNIEVKPEKPVLFILDEMPALGQLTMVETAFGLMAGYGLVCWGICQDLAQLKKIYGDSYESFISNAGVLQYYGSRDQLTSEYFSSLCGVTTVWNWSTALARAVGITRGKGTSRSDTNTSTDTATGTQRKLAYADELMRLPKDRQLLLIDHLNPIMATKEPWFENPDLKDLGVNLYDKD
ncbi:MAG: type IV secretory system conjugative DNA transfer family protein [Lentilitoribacter sp.]